MEKSMGTRGQMSEAVSTGIFLTLSGGFQDAYTYYCRGNVFANAQTGNIVLMGSHLAAREWNLAVRYLAPVLAFAGGVYMAEHVKRLHRQDRRFHWRQLIVAIEIILLFVVGFLPQDMNMAANIIVSFVCALQVNAFRKIKGSPYATTMCIGNLRSATENLYWYRHTGKKDHRDIDGGILVKLRYKAVIHLVIIREVRFRYAFHLAYAYSSIENIFSFFKQIPTFPNRYCSSVNGVSI